MPVVFFLLFSASFIAVALAYQSWGKRSDLRRLPAPGQLVDFGTHRLHLLYTGSAAERPAVVLEAGIASSSLAWYSIQKALGSDVPVITYDRAGLGWSDAIAESRTLPRIVQELRHVLDRSGIAPPYILVGHSYGGLIVRNYAVHYPEEVAGLLLVDPVETSEWTVQSEMQAARLRRGTSLSRRGALMARFGVVRFALALLSHGNSRLPKLIARWSSGKGASVTERLAGEVRKLPKEVWPMIQMHWSDEKCFRTMAEYLEKLPENAAIVERDGWPERIPTIVLTVETAEPALPRSAEHRRAAPYCGHWIQLDQPELVLAAIRELRAKAELRRLVEF